MRSYKYKPRHTDFGENARFKFFCNSYNTNVLQHSNGMAKLLNFNMTCLNTYSLQHKYVNLLQLRSQQTYNDSDIALKRELSIHYQPDNLTAIPEQPLTAG